MAVSTQSFCGLGIRLGDTDRESTVCEEEELDAPVCEEEEELEEEELDATVCEEEEEEDSR